MTRYNDAFLSFSKEVELLTFKILSGEPLKRFCDICLRVRLEERKQRRKVRTATRHNYSTRPHRHVTSPPTV